MLATQRPYPIGTDPVGRALLSFNVRALTSESNTTFLYDLATLISSANLGILWQDLFVGPAPDIPSSTSAPGPYVQIIGTGGMATIWTAEDKQFARLSAQILVRATGYQDAQDRADSVYNLLDGKRNFQV